MPGSVLVPHRVRERIGTSQGGPGDQILQGNVLVPHGGTGVPERVRERIGTSQDDWGTR